MAKKKNNAKSHAGWNSVEWWLPHLKLAAFVIISYLATMALLPYLKGAESLGYAGAFLISMVSSATIVLPTPAFINIAQMASVLDPLWLGIAAGIGSAIGELTGYFAGKQEAAKVKNTGVYRQNEKLLRKWGPAAMFALAALPNPFLDFAGIAAGAIGMPVWQFLASVGPAKIIKYSAIAYGGLWLFGSCHVLLGAHVCF